MLISFDQSSSNCGIVLWEDGKPQVWKVIRSGENAPDVFMEKTRLMWTKIWDFIFPYIDFDEEAYPLVSECCFEMFVDYIPPNFKKQSIAKLHLFSGYVIAKMENFIGKEKVFFVNKGTTPKYQAEIVAKSLGLPENLPKDIYDACFHGFLRNYHKRINE